MKPPAVASLLSLAYERLIISEEQGQARMGSKRLSSRRDTFMSVVAVVALATGIVGCAPDYNDAPGGAVPAFDVVARERDNEYTFVTTSDHFSAGPVQLSLTNEGVEEHQITLIKLNPDVSAPQLETALRSGAPLVDTVFSSGELLGGPNAVAEGATESSIMRLEAGEYVMMCLIPSPEDGVSHALKGMIRPVHVTDPPNKRTLAVPSADVALREYAFAGPLEYPAGQRVDVANLGTQNHELVIYRLDQGQTAQQHIEAGLPGSTVTPSGGITPTAPDHTAQITMPTEPGQYIFICFLPNTAGEGEPHFILGMYAQVTIRDG